MGWKEVAAYWRKKGQNLIALADGLDEDTGLDAPSGNVGDGSFYGRDPGDETLVPDTRGDEMTEPKKGYLTTEFWMTLIAQVMPVLVLLHVVQQGDSDTLQGAAQQIVQAAFAIGASATLIYKYIASRTAVKQASLTSPKG